MRFELLRMEKSLRSFRWLYLGLGMGIFLVVIYGSLPDDANPFSWGDGPGALTPIVFVFWVWVASNLVHGGLLGRCERLCLTLPISSRRLWMLHVVSLVASILLVFAVAIGVVALVNAVRGLPLIKPCIMTLFINITGVAVPAIALFQLPDRESYVIRLNAGNIIYLVIIWLVAWLAIMFFSAMGRSAALLPLGAGILLLAIEYRCMPPLFSLQVGHSGATSQEIDDFRPVTPVERINGSVRPGRWLLHTMILKIFYRHWVTVLFFPWLLLIGILLSGYTALSLNSLTLLAAVVIYMSGLLHYALSRMYMIEPLPVSKKLLHAYLVLPVLCVTLLSYGIGIIAGKGAAPRENLLFYGEKRYDRSLDVRVPLEYWEIGWSGEPAPVETEHDEKPYAAWSTPLFAGADIVLYSPYHTPPGSSPRFVSEQLSKAAERIFGTRLDPAEIESRYFSGNADGESPISGATINIGRDFPELPVRSWQRILPVIVILIGAIWFGITPLTFYMYSSGRNGRILQLVLGAVVTIWILLVIFVTSSGITFGWKVSAFSWILVRKLAGAVPAGTGLLWIVAAAVMFFGCRLSGARFRSIEAPIRRSGAYHR